MSFKKPKRSPILENSQTEITLDSEQYWLGDKISGQIILNLSKDIQIRGIVVGIEGSTIVKLNGKMKSHMFLEHLEKIFGEFSFINGYDVTLMKYSPRDLNGFVTKISKGKNKFDFEIPIPKKDRYPASFESTWGQILYNLAVYVVCFKETFRVRLDQIKPLFVHSVTDKHLNDPQLATPLGVMVGQRAGQKIYFNLEKKLLLPGKQIAFILIVPDCPSTSATITFIQKLYYKLTGNENKTVRNELISMVNRDFDTNWKSFLEIPGQIPASHFGVNSIHCLKGLIDVNYFIMLQVENKNSKRKVCEMLPIKIGSNWKSEITLDQQNQNQNRELAEIAQLSPQNPEENESRLNLPNEISKSSKSIPTYSMLSLYSNTETLPPTYEESCEMMSQIELN